MHDSRFDAWRRYVEPHISCLPLDVSVRERVIDELADLFTVCEREALDEGLTPDRAAAHAKSQVPNWELFSSRLLRSSAKTRRARGRSGSARVVRGLRKERVHMFSGIGKDFRLALRMLHKRAGLVAAATLTLALGIGANTALFSMVFHVLLKPLPYPAPEELVRLWSTHIERDIETMGVSTGDVVSWRLRNEVFAGIGAWYTMGRTLQNDDLSEPVIVAQVSADFFSVMGTRPVLGRTFTEEETAAATFNSAASHTGTDPVVVLSHETWQRRFGGDTEILGKFIALERQRWRVVGVMPAEFDMPSNAVELWIPWSLEGRRPHDQRYLDAVGRLNPGVTLAEAQSQMDAVAAALGAELPDTNEGWGVRLVPAHEDVVGSARSVLWIVFGAVGCVLLIACINIVSLQLVRMIERQREMLVRTAMGASRARLARQLLGEGFTIVFLGGVLAIPVAMFVVGSISYFAPSHGVPRMHEVSVDYRVLGFSALLTLLVGLFCGLVPALAGTSSDIAGTLKEAAGRTTGNARGQRLRSLLVVGEIAITLVLLASAGLLVRSFAALNAIDPGFQPEKVVVLPITLDNHEYDSGAKTRAYYRALIEKLESVPGVVSASGVTALPMSPIGPDFDRPVWAEGDVPPPGGARRADVRMATPEYFRTLGISILKGRPFDERDGPDAEKVVIVNESLARQAFSDREPVGQRLVIDYSTAGTYPYEVVGVVNDIRFHGLRSEARPELYLPHAQRSYLIMNVAVRTASEASVLTPTLQKTVLEVDPLQPAHNAALLTDLVAASVSRDRFAMLLLGAFAVAALALAIIGIFSVVSYHVGQRTHELGIRRALGASPTAAVQLMLSAGARLTLFGLGVGVALALGGTRLLENLLYGVSPTDPLTFLLVLLTIAVAALAACYLPARRAARVDPVVALRHD